MEVEKRLFIERFLTMTKGSETESPENLRQKVVTRGRQQLAADITS